jgi:anti-sigma-K factor RsiG
MTQPTPGGRRRIDRVLSDDFLEGLEERPLAEVRSLRGEAEQEEADLSYARRLLQGRADLVKAELARRSHPTEHAQNDAQLVAQLAGILSEGEQRSDRGLGRFLAVEPSRVDEHRRDVEAIVADAGLSNVEARSEDELRDALRRLGEHEHEISDVRFRVQQVMDRCAAEITRRYREGEARVDDLLPDA